MSRTLKELHGRVSELENVNRNQAVMVWQLEEEKLELGKKIEQLLSKEDQGDADFKIRKVRFTNDVELRDDSSSVGGVGASMRNDKVEELGTAMSEETVESSGGAFCQKARS